MELNKKHYFVIGILIAFISILSIPQIYNSTQTNCNSPMSFYYHCNTISNSWQNALRWINTTLGSNAIPHNNTILTWWDYGDWLNYFGNVNSVSRGDNQIPSLNNKIAYLFVNGNYTQMANFMKNKAKSKYLLMSYGLFQKWGALNYLACIYENKTSFNTSIGTSNCERNNDAQYILYPTDTNRLKSWCGITTQNSTALYIKAIGTNGKQYCLGTWKQKPNGRIYSLNGTLISYLNLLPIGNRDINKISYNQYLLLYAINRTTGKYPTAITPFYNSLYYKMFFEGYSSSLFKQVYPKYNRANPIRIWKVNNYENDT